MVRVAVVVLALTHSTVADEDVYHHTQLLQTRMHPQKVVVDADGQDDVNFFQSSLKKKMHQNSRQGAKEKFIALVQNRAHLGKNSSWGNGSMACPPYVAAEAKVYYGDDVDAEKFCACMYMDFDTSTYMWYPDPNVGMKQVAAAYDECMGATNTVTQACTDEYGPEVGLFDCYMCGTICECPSPQECDLGCHRECMEQDPSEWEYESSWDSSWDSSSYHEEGGECKLFYGPDVDVPMCEECGEGCWNKAYESMDYSDYSYEKEKEFFEGFGKCVDECVGMPNLVTGACQAGYGSDVDVYECMSCGMACNCDLEGCEYSSENYACHPQCMEEDWMVWTSSWSDWSSGNWSSDSWSSGNWSDSSYKWKLTKSKMAMRAMRNSSWFNSSSTSFLLRNSSWFNSSSTSFLQSNSSNSSWLNSSSTSFLQSNSSNSSWFNSSSSSFLQSNSSNSSWFNSSSSDNSSS